MCVHVRMCMWRHRQVWLSYSLGGLTAPPSCSLCFIHADQLNSTGILQLPSLHLVPQEEAESEEGEDYY